MLTHLGKTVEYSSQYDKSLLEVFPRATRRAEAGYTAPMNGIDIWTCYEVSYLLMNGAPEFMVLRIANPADSEYIFESKSLKLYLNSFNNTKFSEKSQVLQIISNDLSEVVGSFIKVVEIKEFNQVDSSEDDISTVGITFEHYSYSPHLLTVEQLEHIVEDQLTTNLLRSNCEVTGQPDWGRVTILYVGLRKLNEKSFIKYLVSFRNHQEFHEPTCERIFNDLYNILSPDELSVVCQYTRRGGIDINPIRTTLSIDEIKTLNLLEELPKQLQQ